MNYERLGFGTDFSQTLLFSRKRLDEREDAVMAEFLPPGGGTKPFRPFSGHCVPKAISTAKRAPVAHAQARDGISSRPAIVPTQAWTTQAWNAGGWMSFCEDRGDEGHEDQQSSVEEDGIPICPGSVVPSWSRAHGIVRRNTSHEARTSSGCTEPTTASIRCSERHENDGVDSFEEKQRSKQKVANFPIFAFETRSEKLSHRLPSRPLWRGRIASSREPIQHNALPRSPNSRKNRAGKPIASFKASPHDVQADPPVPFCTPNNIETTKKRMARVPNSFEVQWARGVFDSAFEGTWHIGNEKG
ncbi:unnamed protein product [Pseudo-nitzschia multistriata]|uniref:Uncharacterized protein n=1 Tax=Pseudo-nitzschia multistriata TaxID=183589 RepID=A0A448ZPH4_9STRA|nr:unnamed protein product [Pseudo-nitzschia multistriata]